MAVHQNSKHLLFPSSQAVCSVHFHLPDLTPNNNLKKKLFISFLQSILRTSSDLTRVIDEFTLLAMKYSNSSK